MNWVHTLIGDMAARRLAPPDGIVLDGNLHRFDVEGDRHGRRNGWYPDIALALFAVACHLPIREARLAPRAIIA